MQASQSTERMFEKESLSLPVIKHSTIIGAGNGIFALGLLSIPPLIVPFQKIIFNIVQSELPNSMILAAINAKVVGVSVISQTAVAPLTVMTAQLRLKHPTIADSSLVSISRFDRFEAIDCLGLGLVRGVDLINQTIIFTFPMQLQPFLDQADLHDPDQYLIVSLGTNINLPSQLSHGYGYPTFPYYGSEFAGEGTAQVKPRTNLKRKAQT